MAVKSGSWGPKGNPIKGSMRPLVSVDLKKVLAPPIRDQLDGYLKRLRHTVPFPISPEEAYFGCMPLVVHRMHEDGLFEKSTSKPGRVSNLLLCLTTAASGPAAGEPVSNIVHVSLDSSAKYKKSEAAEDVFWFTAPDGVPSPVYRHGTQFFLPEDHPHHVVLRQWVHQSLKIENGIQRAFASIAKLEANGPGPQGIPAAWPELMNFIRSRRVTPPMTTGDARRFKMRIDREISPAEKLFTTELLATCIMLPEKNPPLKAWVNFYMEGL